MRKTLNRRAFSIMEAVIAIFVVTIVSLSAVTVATSSLGAKAKSTRITMAQGFARDAWECFKAAEDQTQFLELMAFADSAAHQNTETVDGKTVSTFANEKHHFTATITVTPTASALAFAVVVADEEGEIFSLSYQKGGAVW